MLSKYFITGVFLAGASLLAQSEPQSTPTVEARNKAIATRVFEEIFNQGRFEVANEIYSPDFQNHGYRRDVDLKIDQDAVHAELTDKQQKIQLKLPGRLSSHSRRWSFEPKKEGNKGNETRNQCARKRAGPR